MEKFDVYVVVMEGLLGTITQVYRRLDDAEKYISDNCVFQENVKKERYEDYNTILYTTPLTKDYWMMIRGENIKDECD